MLSCVMHSQTSGEEAVPIRNLKRIPLIQSSETKTPRAAFAPHFYVVLRIANHRGVSCSTRCRMKTHYMFSINVQPPKWVMLLQILFSCIRKKLHIARCFYMIRFDTIFFHFLSIWMVALNHLFQCVAYPRYFCLRISYYKFHFSSSSLYVKIIFFYFSCYPKA